MSEEIVFVCTEESCDGGPWEGSHDAMAHCAEHEGHAYPGRPREEVSGEVIPASEKRERDNRRLQHQGDPEGALGEE